MVEQVPIEARAAEYERERPLREHPRQRTLGVVTFASRTVGVVSVLEELPRRIHERVHTPYADRPGNRSRTPAVAKQAEDDAACNPAPIIGTSFEGGDPPALPTPTVGATRTATRVPSSPRKHT